MFTTGTRTLCQFKLGNELQIVEIMAEKALSDIA
jgi:hypothetical protein